jgi:carbon-monoxide dehydrogenase large subunit
MDDHIDPTAFGLDDRFAIGQPVPRSEDPVLLRGEGRYSDDVRLPGQAYAVMVRSHHAHGVIRRIDTAARVMPRVLAIYTAADLAAGGIGPLPPRQVMNNRDGTPMLSPVRYALATDKTGPFPLSGGARCGVLSARWPVINDCRRTSGCPLRTSSGRPPYCGSAARV